MTSKFGWRQTASVVLAGVIAVCLLFTFAGEAIDFLWFRQPLGNIGWTVAEAFGWLFAVALIAEFVIVASMQDANRRRLETQPFRPGH